MFGPDQQQDCWGRLRVINRPNEIELIILSNADNPFLPNYVPLNFWQENNKGLIEFIRNNKGCKTMDIFNNYFNKKISYNYVTKILNKGRDRGILIPYSENNPSSRNKGKPGKPNNLWRSNIYI